MLIHKSGEIYTVTQFGPMRFIGNADTMENAIRLAEDYWESEDVPF